MLQSCSLSPAHTHIRARNATPSCDTVVIYIFVSRDKYTRSKVKSATENTEVNATRQDCNGRPNLSRLRSGRVHGRLHPCIPILPERRNIQHFIGMTFNVEVPLSLASFRSGSPTSRPSSEDRTRRVIVPMLLYGLADAKQRVADDMDHTAPSLGRSLGTYLAL